MRAIALIVLSAFLFSCSRTVPREGVEVRRYRVEWEKLDAQPLTIGGLELRGVVLTPAQLPLEASLVRLTKGDFTGFIDALDLSFQPSRLPTGVLEDLFDAGFLPAYLQVRNPGAEALAFEPLRLAVRVDEVLLLRPAALQELPRQFRKTDWEKTGLAVAAVALLVVLVALSGKDNRKGGGHLRLHYYNGGLSGRRERSESIQGPPSRQGYLQGITLEPGASREGLAFFRLGGPVADWRTARLVENR